MFTGIIEEVGKIINIESGFKTKTFVISAEKILEDVKIGNSISVNGVCTTVTEFKEKSFKVDLSSQTLDVTTLNDIKTGDFVNLERALKAGGRLGGHIVSGHVDFCAKFTDKKKNGESVFLSFEIPENKTKYFIEKGSVAIDGVSLTVAQKEGRVITVCVIPHTILNTTFNQLEIGKNVNIETDMIGKYVENFVVSNDNKSMVSENFLKENGFL